MGGLSGYLGGMDWQQVLSLVIVAGAAGGLLWAKLRRRPALHRDHPCGCGAASQPVNRSSIVFRARKGERAQVIVKMK